MAKDPYDKLVKYLTNRSPKKWEINSANCQYWLTDVGIDPHMIDELSTAIVKEDNKQLRKLKWGFEAVLHRKLMLMARHKNDKELYFYHKSQFDLHMSYYTGEKKDVKAY